MTWSLNAAGHAITEAGTMGEKYMAEAGALEKELVDELKAVLSNPKYGTTSSTFSGNTVTTALHPTTSGAANTPAAETTTGTTGA